MKPHDQDLLDVLLDDAPEASRARVAAAAADPASPAHQAPWAELLRATRESRAAATRHQHIIEATLARLQAEAPAPSVATASRRWANPIVATASRRWAAAALAVSGIRGWGTTRRITLRLGMAAFAVTLCGAFYLVWLRPMVDISEKPQTEEMSGQLFQQVIAAAPEGATLAITDDLVPRIGPVPMRIAKPVRITAPNETVALGRADS